MMLNTKQRHYMTNSRNKDLPFSPAHVYDSLADALRELWKNFCERIYSGVYVTKEVYDSFDPMEYLNMAVFATHVECCGFGDNRDFAHLEVVDRSSLCRWDEERKDWVPFAWELSWRRPSETVLRKLVSCAEVFYRGFTDTDVRGDQNQITHRQEDTE